MKELTTELKSIVSETMKLILKEFPTINNGGCGVLANGLGDMFINLGYKVEYVFVCRDSSWKKKIDRMIDDVNIPELMGGADWMHILTLVDGHVIDTNGVKTFREYHELGTYNPKMRFSHPFSGDILNGMNSSEYKEVWNNMFNMDLSTTIKTELNNNLQLSV